MAEQNSMTRVKPPKALHIEVLRIMSCLLVIFNHTSVSGYMAFSNFDPRTVSYWICYIFSVCCRIAVAMFFTLSGALLLRKDEPIRVTYKKRISRMVLMLFIASIYYYIAENKFSFKGLSIGQFFEILYTTQHRRPLWFIYLYIAFLIILPFLRAMAKSMRNNHFLYLFALTLIFESIMPAAEWFIFGTSDITYVRLGAYPNLTMMTVYPLLGYYLENKVDIEKYRGKVHRLVTAGICVLLLIIALTICRISVSGDPKSADFTWMFQLPRVALVYIIAKAMIRTPDRETRISKAILSVSTCIFGIYIVHPTVMTLIRAVCPETVMVKLIPGVPVLMGCVFVLATFAISYILVRVLKLIPGLKKLL